MEDPACWKMKAKAWSFQGHYALLEVWDAHRKQASICVFIKHIHLFYFSKWPIVSLDKTLIHCLVSFIAIWSCTETIILTFNDLEFIEVHCMDTNPGMFSSKTLIFFSTEERNTYTSWMTWGWVNYQEILFWKWTNPLSYVKVQYRCI